MKVLLKLIVSFLMCMVCDSTPDYPATYPDQTAVEDAKTRLHQLILDNAEVRPKGTGHPLIGGFVRLAFHDCFGVGFCDGCIDHSIPDNAGLEFYTDMLDPIYDSNYKDPKVMSRADFYAIASLVALEMSTENLTDKFTGLDLAYFKVGRVDCLNSPGEDELDPGFPKAEINNTELVSFFADNFGFSAEETVALMGAHTLGRCHGEFSGFHGKWVSGSNTGIANSDLLDNNYYQRIRGGWAQMNVLDTNGQSSDKIQWQRPGTTPNQVGIDNKLSSLFLNVDMSIAYDINPDSTGHVSCRINCNRTDLQNDPNCCQDAPTNAVWRSYIQSNSDWVHDFQAVFLKMINKNDNENDLRIPLESSKRDEEIDELIGLVEKIESIQDVIKDVMQDY